jgi:NADPH:quinone reductase-like Zn-dependent oxidoreductase
MCKERPALCAVVRTIALTEFGDPDVLAVHELPDPLVGPDQVLIEVRAAGVNPVDFKICRGWLQGAFPHHTPLIPGWDVAGVVSKVGPAVTEFAEGDEVLGYIRKDHVQFGSYAELASAADRMLAHKPASLTFEQAAALPLAGLTALQSLRAAQAGSGDVVLVHAAAGGVGHLAVQLARELGAARVIGTASAPNHEFVRSLGAEPVEYGEGLVRRVAELAGDDGKVDVALDFVPGSSEALEVSAELVRDPARLVSIGDAARVRELGGRYVFVRADAPQLAWLAQLADSGTLQVELQQVFPLERAADAHRLLEAGHVRGKLALTVAET